MFTIKRTYLTMQETLNNTPPIQSQKHFRHLFESVGIPTEYFPEMQTNAHIIKLFQEYIYPRYYNKPITYIDRYVLAPEPTQDEIQEAFKSVYTDIYSWLIGSYEAYSYLIDIYEENRDKLLDNVKTTNTTRFNDTPQDTDDAVGTDFTTHITKNEVENPIATKIQRLDEIRRNIKNIYEEWCKEFENKFVIHTEY